MNTEKIATITLEVTIYGNRVECFAKGTKPTSPHGGKVIKTAPHASYYGPDEAPLMGDGESYDKSIKQAILEATEPQIDYAMEDLGITEPVNA